MFTVKREGRVSFLTEWRLCCFCCRMLNRNSESHLIGFRDGFILFQHYQCPPTKGVPDVVRNLPHSKN